MTAVVTVAPVRVLVLRSADRACALRLQDVREVMRPQPLRPIDSPLAYLDGLALIRGQPTPVVNLARLLGARETPTTRLALLKLGTRSVAIAAGTIEGVRSIDERDIASLPPLVDRSGAGHADEIARLDSELAVVLRAARLLPEATWTGLEGKGRGR